MDETIADIKKRQEFLFAVQCAWTVSAIRNALGDDPVDPSMLLPGAALAVPIELIPNDPNEILEFALALGRYIMAGSSLLLRPKGPKEFPKLKEWVLKGWSGNGKNT